MHVLAIFLSVAMSTLTLSADSHDAAVPAALACLARYYAVEPRFEDGAWWAKLPGGARVPFDDRKSKSWDERLESPDIKDMLVLPYATGPIRPILDENDDPGRIRVEAVFAATYGGRRAAAEQRLVRFLGLPVRMHRKVVPALERVAARIENALATDPGLKPFLGRLSGGFAVRTIAGTTRTSPHAYGIAIDLDKSKSDYWRWEGKQTLRLLRWRNRIPQAIVDAFEAEGFIWGGRWYHYDTMHFEYRPELALPCLPLPSSKTN